MASTNATHTTVKKLTFAWTSSAGGAATVTSTGSHYGRVIEFVTIPGAGGEAPTDNYDITITDSDSVDVAAGALANRDTANTEVVVPDTNAQRAVHGVLTVNVTNAGNANTGTVVVYYR